MLNFPPFPFVGYFCLKEKGQIDTNTAALKRLESTEIVCVHADLHLLLQL